MTDIRISRACNAARKQGYLDGLRKSAALVCKHCAKNFGRQPIKPTHKNGRWWHATGAQTATRCRASAIHDEIAATVKHGDPPVQPGQHMTKHLTAQQKRSNAAWTAWRKTRSAKDLQAWKTELAREGLNQASIDLTVASHIVRLSLKDGP